MSGARGRKAQGSAEVDITPSQRMHPDAAAVGSGLVMGTGAAATAGLMGIMVKEFTGGGKKSPAKRREENKKKREKRRARRAARGGGGGLYVTPDAATGRDVTKRFKRN